MNIMRRLEPVLKGFFAGGCFLMFLVFCIFPFLGVGRFFFDDISCTNGRESQTHRTLTTLKYALINYSSDVGRFPHCSPGKLGTVEGFGRANRRLLGLNADNNVLVTCGLATQPILLPPNFKDDPLNYGRRWKGPYLDSSPNEFMRDGWDNPIRYGVCDKHVILHSAGRDRIFETVSEVMKTGYEGDDILLSVSRLRYDPPRETPSVAEGTRQTAP